MAKALVGVVLGSRADFNIMKRGLESLRVMGVPYVFEMASAHRTPDRLSRFAASAAEQGLEVIICAAGGSALMAASIASQTILPVIAVPVDTTPLRGQDALYSMVQAPPGAPVATVGINNAENAALLATQILAIKYPHYRAVLTHARAAAQHKMESTHKEMIAEYPDLCDSAKTAPAYAQAGVADDDTDPGADGAEEVTPDPKDSDKNLRIRPGAILGQPAPTMKPVSLVKTPPPHEPSAVTEDLEITAEVAKAQAAAAAAVKPTLHFPAPPSLSDLTPEPMPQIHRPAVAPPADTPRTGYETEREFPLPDPPTPLPPALAAPPEITVETKVFEIAYDNPDVDILSHAMMVLLEGGIVAFPTDTVYGLAVDATNADAVKKLYEVKGREAQRKALSVLIHEQSLLDTLVKEVPPAIEGVLERYWPGGLTVLFYKHPTILPSVSESPSMAIRIPNDGIALRIMQLVERPLAVINAALGAAPAAINAREVIDRFNGKIDCVLDAGPVRSAETSTVLSVLTEPFEILREGCIPRTDLKKMLGGRLKD
ncbi:hypothetical protein BH09SUM1_BH09SUM1_17880 [soil metagenome]